MNCETQEEVDYFWDKLSAGGDEAAQQCGWLKDKFGASWQVVPTVMQELMGDPDNAKSQRAFAAMMKMKKLDIAELKRRLRRLTGCRARRFGPAESAVPVRAARVPARGGTMRALRRFCPRRRHMSARAECAR